MLYGMSLPIILQLRTEYHKLGGCEPITDESIREIFRRAAAMPNIIIHLNSANPVLGDFLWFMA